MAFLHFGKLVFLVWTFFLSQFYFFLTIFVHIFVTPKREEKSTDFLCKRTFNKNTNLTKNMSKTAQSVWGNCLSFIKDNIQDQAYFFSYHVHLVDHVCLLCLSDFIYAQYTGRPRWQDIYYPKRLYFSQSSGRIR